MLLASFISSYKLFKEINYKITMGDTFPLFERVGDADMHI